MSDVKRYDCYGKDALGYDYPALSREAIDGDWVLAEDHIAECDALKARLAEATQLLEEWHRAYHADQWGEGVDDDTTTWLAGISPFKDRAADSADACPHRYDPTTCFYAGCVMTGKCQRDEINRPRPGADVTADAGHSVQCSECGATHVLRYTDRAKTAVSLAGFDGWSVDSSRVRCPKCSTASTVSVAPTCPRCEAAASQGAVGLTSSRETEP